MKSKKSSTDNLYLQGRKTDADVETGLVETVGRRGKGGAELRGKHPQAYYIDLHG